MNDNFNKILADALMKQKISDSMEKMVECPFCGVKPEPLIDMFGWTVLCKENSCPCNPQTKVCFASLEEAISDWNTRVSNVPKVGGRCKECKHYDGDYWCRNDDIPVCGDDAARFMPSPDFFCALFERRSDDDSSSQNQNSGSPPRLAAPDVP